MALKTLLVGLGQIGAGYDLTPEAGQQVFTHAKAVTGNPRFSLVAGVDPDADCRRRFEAVYGVSAFPSVTAVPHDLLVDVAIVASPTASHARITCEVLERFSLRAVLCEKPLAASVAEARRIVEACAARAVPLFVNYIRRADPAVTEIKQRLDRGEIQAPVIGIVWFSGGLLHNGSHFLELLSYWFGSVQSASRIDGVGCRFCFRDGAVLFLEVPAGTFALHSIELLAANGRLHYQRGGDLVEWQPVTTHPVLPDRRALADAERIASGMARYQSHVFEQLARAIDGLTHTLCDGQQGLAMVEWITRVEQE